MHEKMHLILSHISVVFFTMQAPFLNDMLQTQLNKIAVQDTGQSRITCSVTSFLQLQSIWYFHSQTGSDENGNKVWWTGKEKGVVTVYHNLLTKVP